MCIPSSGQFYTPCAESISHTWFQSLSGKSSVILAIQVMREIVLESANYQLGQPLLMAQPFKLDLTGASEPTEFEMTFLQKGVRDPGLAPPSVQNCP